MGLVERRDSSGAEGPMWGWRGAEGFVRGEWGVYGMEWSRWAGGPVREEVLRGL